MKVFVADSLAKEGLDLLKQVKALAIIYKPGLSGKDLEKEMEDCDALVVRSATKVTRELLAKAKNLKIIGRAGIGVDNIDCQAATERGVIVMNTPSGNAVTTAEHAMALLMAMARYVPQAHKSVTEGKWEKSKFTGTEVTGKTLGLLGLGNIGRIVADRALGLKMRVLVHDPYLNDSVALKQGIELVSLEDLCRRSDFITIHVPLNDSTRNLIGKKAISWMKEGVRIINCARGGIVDEEALLNGLNAGTIAGAALDVFVQEPPAKDHLLLKHEKVICTPHLGAATEEAQVNVAVQVAEQIRDYFQSGEIRNAVNFPSISSEMLKVLKPYLSLCQKLGRFQGQICRINQADVKKIEISYSGSVTEYPTAVLTSSLLYEFLFPLLGQSVNFINARNVAVSRSIIIEEKIIHQVQDFANQITLTVSGDKGSNLISGVIFGQDNQRFVKFNDFSLEVVPEGYLLVVHNYDRPGVVGKMGTMLGNHKINISRMQLTLNRPKEAKKGSQSDQAVAFINIDQPAGSAVQDELNALENVIAVYQIDLN